MGSVALEEGGREAVVSKLNTISPSRLSLGYF